MIYINNSQYVEVSNVSISSSGTVDNAVVTITLKDIGTDSEVASFDLESEGNGKYRAEIPADLPVEKGKKYKMVTTINAEGLQGQWEQIVDARVRRQ